jgi:hypothetical protein
MMTDIAMKVAQFLLPRDAEEVSAALLERMTENHKFCQFALPSLDDSSSS